MIFVGRSSFILFYVYRAIAYLLKDPKNPLPVHLSTFTPLHFKNLNNKLCCW